MIIMPREECRSYLVELRPYLKISLIFFGIGIAIGLMIVSRYPGLADHFEDSVANFIRTFRGLPRLQLAGAIFLNNASKTLLAITLGTLFGVVPGIFLLTNGVALGVVFTLAAQSKGLWLSLLSILPHGVIELPGVFLGTSIGLLVGSHAVKTLRRRTDAALIFELKRGIRFFCTVIVPLLLVAAFVEAFVTATLISPF
jgi:stage II sporulation protein M